MILYEGKNSGFIFLDIVDVEIDVTGILFYNVLIEFDTQEDVETCFTDSNQIMVYFDDVENVEISTQDQAGYLIFFDEEIEV